MQISYELDDRDTALFTLYRSLESADVKRKKVVLRWMIAIMLLAIIPIFQLHHSAAITLILAICFLWLSFGSTFMNHVLLKQILKEQEEKIYERIEIVSVEEALMIYTAKTERSYKYEDITHFLYFKKLLLLTLQDGSSILIPRHAFNSKQDYKAFYMHILNHCPQ
ncbi:YcxB family protein [[Clostridium] innocuum]|nr:YcxB family protein [Erysipelotrichaceae bacterium]MCR0382110.1 YcxB family protein [[Clostridium] innocuum]MCR0413354.1 YcxB family protein [[Clostridium] innocuum]MCR0535707.1 YcxB family protein [[Clostridium] innocuum]MCR0539743.1 YcxB family protein [[Clostridium] innocuum]